MCSFVWVRGRGRDGKSRAQCLVDAPSLHNGEVEFGVSAGGRSTKKPRKRARGGRKGVAGWNKRRIRKCRVWFRRKRKVLGVNKSSKARWTKNVVPAAVVSSTLRHCGSLERFLLEQFRFRLVGKYQDIFGNESISRYHLAYLRPHSWIFSTHFLDPFRILFFVFSFYL